MAGDQLGDLKRLEERFARAMQELYAVGNGLAALRQDVQAQTHDQPQGHGQSQSQSQPPGPGPNPAPAPANALPGSASPTLAPQQPQQPQHPQQPRHPQQSQPAYPPLATPSIPPVPPGHGFPSPAQTPRPAAAPVPSPVPAPWSVPGPDQGATSAPGQPAYVPATPGHPAYAQLGQREPVPVPATAPQVPLWEREGFVTRVLGFTGALVTLAGLVMLLVLAVQQNWFGPIPRVIAGWVLAIGLIVGAHLIRARETRAGRAGHGAVALAATGYAAAFLCVVAMTSIYGWLPAAVGLVLAALVTATGLVIARRWSSQALAALIVIGAALHAPFVTDRASWVLSAFIVVLAVAAWPAQIGRGWPVVTAARMLPTTLVVVPTALIAQARPHEPWAHLAVTALLAVAGLVMAGIDVRKDPHPEVASMTVVLASIPLLVTAGLPVAPWHTIAYAVSAAAWLGIAGSGEAGKKLPSAITIPAMAFGTLALLAAIFSPRNDRWSGTLLLVAAATYLVVAGVTRSRLATWAGLFVTALALLGYLRHPFDILVEHTALRADMTVVVVDSLATVGVVAALAWLAARTRELTVTQRRWARAIAWVVGLSVATTALVAAGVLLGRSAANASGGFRAGHALATILWMATAVWLLGLGLRRARDAKLSIWVGLALAAVAVGKLFLYDLAALNGIWRVIAFIVVGLMLLAAGTGYAKALERARASSAPESLTVPPPPPPPADLADPAAPTSPHIQPPPPAPHV